MYLYFPVIWSRPLFGRNTHICQWLWHPLIQDNVTSNARAWLSNATLGLAVPHSYFQCFWLVKLLASWWGSGLLFIRHFVNSNAGSLLSNATFRLLNLTEQCRTHEFFMWLKIQTAPAVLIQDIVTSNAAAWLSNATLRFFAWLSSTTLMKFCYDRKMKTTQKMKTNSNTILT